MEKQFPGGGSCNKTHAPHSRQRLSFTSCEIDSWGPGGVGLKHSQCGYLCRLFLPPLPTTVSILTTQSHPGHVHRQQLGLSRGLLKKPVKAEVLAPQPRASWGNFLVPSRR